MLSNRKIKKMLKQELEPPPDVDEFCNACGIEFTAPQKAAHKRKRWIPILSSLAAAVVVVVVCCIPLMLPNKDSELPMYGYADVLNSDCSIERIATKNIIMFDVANMQRHSEVHEIVLAEDANKSLGYEIKDVVYGKQIENVLYAYQFDYRIRTYRNYEFIDINNYSNLSSTYKCDKIDYKYKISHETAYISFTANSVDYFIELQGYGDRLDINDNTVKTFIQIAFGEV